MTAEKSQSSRTCSACLRQQTGFRGPFDGPQHSRDRPETAAFDVTEPGTGQPRRASRAGHASLLKPADRISRTVRRSATEPGQAGDRRIDVAEPGTG